MNELSITVQAVNVVSINIFIHISFGEAHFYIDMYQDTYPLKMSSTVHTVCATNCRLKRHLLHGKTGIRPSLKMKSMIQIYVQDSLYCQIMVVPGSTGTAKKQEDGFVKLLSQEKVT